MRILEVHKLFYPNRGADRHFVDVVELLEKNGHEVAVFSMRHPKNKPSSFDRFFVPYVGYNKHDSTLRERIIGIGRLFWSFRAAKNMRELLAVFRPDVAHLHNIYHQLSPSIVKELFLVDIPVYMTIHDYNLISPDKDMYHREIGRKYWKYLFVQKYSFGKRLLLVLKKYFEDFHGWYDRGVSLYIVPSNFVREECIHAGIPPEKIRVLPHFVDVEIGSCSQPEVKNLLDTVSSFVLYAGALTPEKNITQLFKAFDNTERNLVLVGEKHPEVTLPERSNRVFLGHQPKECVLELMRRSEYVVSPSRLPETFGLIALEALSCGTPFLGFRTGAFPEIIRPGENGWLVETEEEFRNAVGRVRRVDLKFSSEEIQKNTRESFSSEQYLQRLLEIFKRPIR